MTTPVMAHGLEKHLDDRRFLKRMAKSPTDFTDTIREEIDGVEEEYRLRIYKR